jgi:hypothetical protein
VHSFFNPVFQTVEAPGRCPYHKGTKKSCIDDLSQYPPAGSIIIAGKEFYTIRLGNVFPVTGAAFDDGDFAVGEKLQYGSAFSIAFGFCCYTFAGSLYFYSKAYFGGIKKFLGSLRLLFG